jgi:2-polyprenyl-3-methyl-5-hydroxy-6-metoxy-1,4-benzoquinol methylase
MKGNMSGIIFEELDKICKRPAPFEFYTAADLWTDKHTSREMLKFHLDGSIDISSRRIEFIDRSVEWIQSNFNVNKETAIADFGCGPGLYAVRLAQKQAAVTAIDFSQYSIEYARNAAIEQGLTIDYVCQDYLKYTTDKRFDLIMMIMCDFCALSPDQRRQMLQKFRTLLQPGGSILFDVYTLNAFNLREETLKFEQNMLNGFWSSDKYYGFLNTFKYDREKVILDKYSIFEANRTRTVYNWLQYFGLEDLKSELADCGLKIKDVFADVTGKPFDPAAYEMAVVVELSKK